MSAIALIEYITFYAALAVLLVYAYILMINRGIPNVQTAPSIRKDIISMLKKELQQSGQSPCIIFDLGAGSGAFTRELARALPQAKIIGIEISRWAVIRARIYQKLCRLNNLSYRVGNLHDADLSGAHAVVFYLSAHFMPQIRQTLEAKLQPGTLVISNKFPLGGDWIPHKIRDVMTFHPRQKTYYIYYKPASH